MWSTLEDELDGPLDIHETGGLMVAETPDELQLLYDKQVIEREAGLETHVLTGRELREFAPYLADDLTGASYCPDEGHANPLARRSPVRASRSRARRRRSHARGGDRDRGRSGRRRRSFTVTTAAGRIARPPDRQRQRRLG